jgi:glucosamine-6-phosphate deaminase
MTLDDSPRLDLRVFPDRERLGAAAAGDIAAEIQQTVAAKGSARVVFASAPSQQETLRALAGAKAVDWSLVTAFQMDEYLGLPTEAPQRFGNWLRDAFFDRIRLGAVHYMDPDLPADQAAQSYAALLRQQAIDIVCLGIGVNGHIAFNDPEVADFDDPEPVKVVDLDLRSRRQQVDDGLFEVIDQVPRQAITLTVPTLMSARRLFCMVPGVRKAEALAAAVRAPIDTTWPCTVLRTHPRCTVYADADAASLLDPGRPVDG